MIAVGWILLCGGAALALPWPDDAARWRLWSALVILTAGVAVLVVAYLVGEARPGGAWRQEGVVDRPSMAAEPRSPAQPSSVYPLIDLGSQGLSAGRTAGGRRLDAP